MFATFNAKGLMHHVHDAIGQRVVFTIVVTPIALNVDYSFTIALSVCEAFKNATEINFHSVPTKNDSSDGGSGATVTYCLLAKFSPNLSSEELV